MHDGWNYEKTTHYNLPTTYALGWGTFGTGSQSKPNQ